MKRTLLLNPPSFQDFDGGAGSRYQATREVTSFWYPTWLCYPAGLIPGSRVVDAPPENLTVGQVASLAGDFELAVLFTTSPSFRHDLETVSRLKEKNPQILVGLVGPQVSILAQESLAAGPQVDFVARREFDYAVAEIAQGRPWQEIEGVSYRQGDAIYHNPDRPYLEDLDALPMVTEIYHRDLRMENYQIPYLRYPYVSFYTGRGCPGQCVYCLWPQTFTGRRYRVRSVANVVAEVRRSLELFPQSAEIFFDDDTFTANGERARSLAREFRGLKFLWSTTAWVTTSYETLQAMKEGGLRLLVVGFETGDPQVLKNIHKGATLDQGRRLVKVVQGIGHSGARHLHGGPAGGNPGQPGGLHAICLRTGPGHHPGIPGHPLPGHRVLRLLPGAGITQDEARVHGSTGYQQCVVDYPGLSASEIFAAVPKFYRRFYFRPSYMGRAALVMLRDPGERRRLLKEGRQFLSFMFRRRQSSEVGTKAGDSCR